MITDLVQYIIDIRTDHFGCCNCKGGRSIEYANKNSICSGIVSRPTEEKPYDIIRICVINNEKHDTNDYTPDEALSIISVLSDAVADWMCNTKAYKEFRTPSKAKLKRGSTTKQL